MHNDSDSSLLRKTKQVHFVPANLLAVASFEDRQVPMRVEEIDCGGLFLISKEYVPPRAVFSVELLLPGDPMPLSALLTASFVERTWDGYGIGAQISCLSTAAQQRWDRYYHQRLAWSGPTFSARFLLEKFLQTQRIVALPDTLPERVCRALHELGVEVVTVSSLDAACELHRHGAAQLFIAAIGEGQADGLELCRKLNLSSNHDFSEKRHSPRILLLADSAAFHQFDGTLYEGATKVVAWPCAHAMLTTRIVALLADPQLREAHAAKNPARAAEALAIVGGWFEQLSNRWVARRA
jgi:CheY-like chemotaxis protein